MWQLSQQFPGEFEFTETYLTTLWDSAHVSIFDTFIFNCERDRSLASKVNKQYFLLKFLKYYIFVWQFTQDPNTPLILRSVWDWREQFSEQDIMLFYSPLYDLPSTINDKQAILKPQCTMPHLELWMQCYFRWIPPLQIHTGGRNHIELFHRLLKNGVTNQLKTTTTTNNGGGECASPVDKIATYLLQMNIDSFYPFGVRRTAGGNNAIMNSSILMNESLLDSQSLLNAPDWFFCFVYCL